MLLNGKNAGEWPELAPQYEHTVRSVPDERVPFPRDIQNIVDHPLFQRLRAVKQLAFVDRVYPDATHSRFAHSLGVYGNAIRYVQALLANEWAGQFRELLNERDLRTLLVAALLHDLAQYPFAHAIEDLHRRASGRIGSDSLNHEALTRRLILDADFRRSLTVEFGYEAEDLGHLIEAAGTSTDDVAAVLAGEGTATMSLEVSRLLRSIVDGPIDVDKLDYLRRDSHHAGVQFGLSIDVGRLLMSLAVVERQPAFGSEAVFEIGVIEKGVSTAEEMLMARAHMFTQVYWHRTVRAHEAALASAIGKLRRATIGLDAWFSSTVLGPRIGDGDLISECTRLCGGNGDESVEILTSPSSKRLREEASGLLSSLQWYSGRSPYKQLVELGAREDILTYNALQRIREYATLHAPELFDELAERLASAMSSKLGVSVRPEHLLFDVPTSRSAANNVAVVRTEEPHIGRVSNLAEHSPFWRKFGEGFHEATCMVRLFAPAHVREQLRETESNFKQVVLNELQEASVSVGKSIAEQTELEM